MQEADFESVMPLMVEQVLQDACCSDEAIDVCVLLSAEHRMSRRQLIALIGEVEGATSWRLDPPTFH